MNTHKHIISAGIVVVIVVLLVFYTLIASRMRVATHTVSDEVNSMSILSESEARLIAESVCIKGGESLAPGTHNAVTQTWWFDANLNATQPGCSPACVVHELSGIAEINWRCAGLLPPTEEELLPEPPLVDAGSEVIACTADAKLCPDGSAVGRVAPTCEFAPCPNDKEMGTVWGIITMGPTCPVMREDEPSCEDKPYVGTVRLIELGSPRSSPTAETTTDDMGGYMMNAPFGSYTVNVLTTGPFPSCNQLEITVNSTEPMRVDITCDTGIR